MQRWAALFLLLLVLAVPLCAQEKEEHVDPGEQHERLEVYYNRSFFNEPWRLDDAPQTIRREAVSVSIAAGVLLGVLIKTRRSG